MPAELVRAAERIIYRRALRSLPLIVLALVSLLAVVVAAFIVSDRVGFGFMAAVLLYFGVTGWRQVPQGASRARAVQALFMAAVCLWLMLQS